MERDRHHGVKPQVFLVEQGFTLIELLITAVVVILALGGYIAANSRMSQRSAEMFEKSIALQAANSVIEQMRLSAANGQFPENVTQTFPNNAQVQGFNNLSNQQVIVSYGDAAADPLDVTVRVTWVSRGQRPISTDLRTFVTRRVV